MRIIQFTDCYWQNSTGWIFLDMQIVLKISQAWRSREKGWILTWNIRWKICFFPSGFQGKSSWREGTIPAFQGTTQSPLVVARVSQHKLRWHFISRAQDRSTRGPSGEFLVGSICPSGGLKFEKCWDWFFNWDLGNNLSYFLDVFRQVICLGKAFTLLVCLKLVIVLSALCFFF